MYHNLKDVSPTELELPCARPSFFRKPRTQDLFMVDVDRASPLDPIVWVVSDGRIREASEAERGELINAESPPLYKLERYFRGNDQGFGDVVRRPQQVSVEKIFRKSFVEKRGWDVPYNPDAWARYDILLSGRPIRRSHHDVRGPFWDSDLGLYIWSESGWRQPVPAYFVMDHEGHYRKWRTGRYVGKLPKGRLGTPRLTTQASPGPGGALTGAGSAGGGRGGAGR